MDSTLDEIQSILNANQDKEFVRRIIRPEQYPELNLGNGNHATHKMAYARVGDKYIVFPTVFYNPNSRNLYELPPIKAIQKAMGAGEVIPFSTEGEAEWFSKNYKKVWGK